MIAVQPQSEKNVPASMLRMRVRGVRCVMLVSAAEPAAAAAWPREARAAPAAAAATRLPLACRFLAVEGAAVRVDMLLLAMESSVPPLVMAWICPEEMGECVTVKSGVFLTFLSLSGSLLLCQHLCAVELNTPVCEAWRPVAGLQSWLHWLQRCRGGGDCCGAPRRPPAAARAAAPAGSCRPPRLHCASCCGSWSAASALPWLEGFDRGVQKKKEKKNKRKNSEKKKNLRQA